MEAQDATAGKHKIGLSATPINNLDVTRFADLIGTSTPQGAKSFSFCLDYFYPLNRWIDLETGIQFAHHDLEGQITYPPFETYSFELSHLEIPLIGRFYLGKYLFANGGLLMGFDLSKSQYLDNQTGLGVALGAGAKYNIGSSFSIFINPTARLSTLIPFDRQKYHQRSVFTGIKTGVTYSLPKK